MGLTTASCMRSIQFWRTAHEALKILAQLVRPNKMWRLNCYPSNYSQLMEQKHWNFSPLDLAVWNNRIVLGNMNLDPPYVPGPWVCEKGGWDDGKQNEAPLSSWSVVMMMMMMMMMIRQWWQQQYDDGDDDDNNACVLVAYKVYHVHNIPRLHEFMNTKPAVRMVDKCDFIRPGCCHKCSLSPTVLVWQGKKNRAKWPSEVHKKPGSCTGIKSPWQLVTEEEGLGKFLSLSC